MPVGFEKQITPKGFADLLAFLTKRGKFVPLSLKKVATAVSTKGMFHGPENDVERLVFPDWSSRTVRGVPFSLVDPQGDRVPNVVMLHGEPNGSLSQKMPKSEFAFGLHGRQLRYLTVIPQRPEPIVAIDLVKGPDATAPIVMALTAEMP